MRLINADKTKNSLWGFERYTGIDEMPIEYAEEIIDKQPTVEAIPIVWLDMFMQRYKIQGDDEYKLLHFMVTEWKKWEKENE